MTTEIPNPPGFRLWNLYNPQDRVDLGARLHEIVAQFAAPDADLRLCVAAIFGEFDRISPTAGPGESRYVKHEPDAHAPDIACAQCPP